MAHTDQRRDVKPIALLGAGSPSFATEAELDLRALGYEVVTIDLDAPQSAGPAAIAVLMTEKSATACATASDRLRTLHGPMPIIWIVGPDDLAELAELGSSCDDFVETPYSRPVLDARLRRARANAHGPDPEILHAGELALDLGTYRASVAGAPLELTYMEYELLRFMMATKGRVHTREMILRQVWGYDYYGGIRTVDVHVRRLRAKLGQEHARSIKTVRSVGYGLQI